MSADILKCPGKPEYLLSMDCDWTKESESGSCWWLLQGVEELEEYSCFVTLIILNRTESVFISLLRAEKRIDLSAMSSSQYNNETFERAAEMSDECQCYYFLSYYQQ